MRIYNQLHEEKYSKLTFKKKLKYNLRIALKYPHLDAPSATGKYGHIATLRICFLLTQQILNLFKEY
jgi:hypothetical protein